MDILRRIHNDWCPAICLYVHRDGRCCRPHSTLCVCIRRLQLAAVERLRWRKDKLKLATRRIHRHRCHRLAAQAEAGARWDDRVVAVVRDCNHHTLLSCVAAGCDEGQVRRHHNVSRLVGAACHCQRSRRRLAAIADAQAVYPGAHHTRHFEVDRIRSRRRRAQEARTVQRRKTRAAAVEHHLTDIDRFAVIADRKAVDHTAARRAGRKRHRLCRRHNRRRLVGRSLYHRDNLVHQPRVTVRIRVRSRHQVAARCREANHILPVVAARKVDHCRGTPEGHYQVIHTDALITGIVYLYRQHARRRGRAYRNHILAVALQAQHRICIIRHRHRKCTAARIACSIAHHNRQRARAHRQLRVNQVDTRTIGSYRHLAARRYTRRNRHHTGRHRVQSRDVAVAGVCTVRYIQADLAAAASLRQRYIRQTVDHIAQDIAYHKSRCRRIHCIRHHHRYQYGVYRRVLVTHTAHIRDPQRITARGSSREGVAAGRDAQERT